VRKFSWTYQAPGQGVPTQCGAHGRRAFGRQDGPAGVPAPIQAPALELHDPIGFWAVTEAR